VLQCSCLGGWSCSPNRTLTARFIIGARSDREISDNNVMRLQFQDLLQLALRQLVPLTGIHSVNKMSSDQ
jgi:hypothetical protein